MDTPAERLGVAVDAIITDILQTAVGDDEDAGVASMGKSLAGLMAMLGLRQRIALAGDASALEFVTSGQKWLTWVEHGGEPPFTVS